jgi:hypothetical protein
MPPAFVTSAAESIFRVLARARGGRALHPHGPLLAAKATLDGGLPDVPALARAREVDALVRPSQALGLGGHDLKGFAVRLVDLHGPGRHQDLLLTSSPPPPWHVVLAPAGAADRAWYTSLLPYRVGARRTLVVAHGLGERRWALGVCGPLRRDVRWFGVVDASADRVLEPDPAEAVAFDPLVYADATLRQAAGPLDAVREAAYVGSREGRAGG